MAATSTIRRCGLTSAGAAASWSLCLRHRARDARQQQFQQILRKLGFTVKLKPYIQRSDGSAKGDWDVGITIDVLDAAARVDEVVLASGDGDFDLLLERVRCWRRGHCLRRAGAHRAVVDAATRYVPIEGICCCVAEIRRFENGIVCQRGDSELPV